MTWEWFNTGAGAASIVGLIVTIGSIISGWHLKRLQADIHASTQSTLTDMRKGFAESQQQLGAILERMDRRLEQMDQRTDRLAEILDRIDQRAEERYRDLRGRRDGEV